MEFEKGDRVVVDGVVTGEKVGSCPIVCVGGDHEPWVPPGDIYLHPGDWEIEHVADLVRECKLASKWRQRWDDFQRSSEYTEYVLLVRARQDDLKAAAEPQKRMIIGITEHGDMVYAVEDEK